MELTEAFLAGIAGWEAMKRARAHLQSDQVLSSAWEPPLLRGMVQDGAVTFRAGLVIKSPTDVENICSCRVSREWGTICAHSVAVGLHTLQAAVPAASGPARSARPRLGAKENGAVMRGLRVDLAGEPLAIHVVFPPQLERGVASGKLMLCFEGEWQGKRAPLNVLPRAQPFSLSAQDQALLAKAQALAGGEPPAMLVLEESTLASVLDLLVDHPNVRCGRATALRIVGRPWSGQIRARLMPSGEIELRCMDQPSRSRVIGGAWVFVEGMLQRLGEAQWWRELFKGPVRLPRSEVPQFLIRDWPRLTENGDLDADFFREDFELSVQPPRFGLQLKGGLARLQARLECDYGGRVVSACSVEDFGWTADPAVPTRYWTRDGNAERGALALLVKAGFVGPDREGLCHLQGQDQVLRFLARDFARLQRLGWGVTMEERLEQSTERSLERIEPRFEVASSGVEWFDLNITYASTHGERFDPAEIQRLLLSGRSHTRLRNGKTALLDTEAFEELRELLRDCSPQQNAGTYRLPLAQAGFVESSLHEQAWRIAAPAAWRDWTGQAVRERPACPPLGELEAVLRPYQKEGVAWLHFLRRNRFGGILADEMGLGKTVQLLAFLTTLPDRSHPVLVVCPTSLVFNWAAEARTFAPRLRVLALQGSERHRLFAAIPEADLVVTSYALMRRDEERYRELQFDTVVLDEAQHIKNRQTQNAQAVKRVRADYRLVLTGTPLENSVLDLWSIFDFLMPGYLGSAADFRERYEVPMVRERNREAQARLTRRVRPFLLRRLKRDVARDLPAKLEQVSYCELTDDQRQVYQQVLEAGRTEIQAAVGAQGLARSRLLVLQTLLRLRQVCCDLRLLGLESVDPATASAKLDLFGELLEEALDGNHRVLVFSQFVSMLKLLRDTLVAESIDFCYLDGATSNRSEVVTRFQNSPSIPVFLISLKAGGTGLNLTGADTVIHFDPWWNPAVEDQATDRAHRITQTRVVTSYKLIARQTVEEKILLLQARKREVIQETLGGEEQLTELLNWEELQELLSQ